MRETWHEFVRFLKEYNVVAMAIAFMMGVVSKDLVQSLVDNIIMPFITPFINNGSWETASVMVGPAEVKWGAFLAAALNFAIIAFVVFIIARKLLNEENVSKK